MRPIVWGTAAVLCTAACKDDAIPGDSPDGSVTETTEPGGDTGTGAPPAISFAEMCAGSGVVFCDDFEDGFDGAWIEDGGDVAVVAGAAVEGEGEQVLELRTYEGQQSSKLLYEFDGVDEVYVRFDVQYADDYDNSGGSHGPILGGSTSPPWGMLGTAGIRPDGDDHFVLNHEPIGTVGSGGEFGFYAYFANMQQDGNGDFWGNLFASDRDPPPLIEPGTWQCVELGITMNPDPSSPTGRADFWVDGVLHGAFEGFQWRTAPELQANTLALDSYNHFRDGARPATSPNRVRYDNLVISTSPVGCLAAR